MWCQDPYESPFPELFITLPVEVMSGELSIEMMRIVIISENSCHTVERFGWLCYAYCLMDNHYHLLIETTKANIR